MNFKLKMLETIVVWLTSGELMRIAKQLVENAASKSMTGEEKRQYVQTELLQFFREYGMVFINLAIEVAVATLTVKIQQDGR